MKSQRINIPFMGMHTRGLYNSFERHESIAAGGVAGAAPSAAHAMCRVRRRRLSVPQQLEIAKDWTGRITRRPSCIDLFTLTNSILAAVSPLRLRAPLRVRRVRGRLAFARISL